MRVLFISSEIFPFAKSGGLGDVAASLPKALSQYCDVKSIMPIYSSIDLQKHNITSTQFFFNFWINGENYYFELFQNENTLFLKDFNNLFNREQMYGDYDDNDIRFGIFCYAVMEYLKQSGEEYDILHINDWQSALVAILAKEHYFLSSKIVFTIHNLAYQGIFTKDSINRLDLKWDYFTPAILEYHDNINLLKAAIALSDIVTTVSPTYAQEIQTSEFGCSLELFIQENAYKTVGILNGIDYDEFSPQKDRYLSFKYNGEDLSFKVQNKNALLNDLFLHNKRLPLFVFIGRFTSQKGIDQILGSLENLQYLPINIAILGSGEEHYNIALASLSHKYENVSITIGYNEALARRMYASADFLYMPSLYEPCGLNQMIAMKYGTIPIVREVGGLKDSVDDFTKCCPFDSTKGVGITFGDDSPSTLINATQRALELFHKKKSLKEVISHDMSIDFSWKHQAKEYQKLYEKLNSGWLPERMIKEFEIPSRYNIDTLKTIAVNPKTIYTYWEVTSHLVSKYHTSYDALKLRAYADMELLSETDLYHGEGDYYFYNEIDFKEVWTQIGFYTSDGEFEPILTSNRFIAPNSKVIHSDQIIWRNIATFAQMNKKFLLRNEKFYETHEHFSSGMLTRRESIFEKSFLPQRSSSTILHAKGEN